MPVPTQVSDLSTTIASNSPAGSDNVFPDLDNHIRALAGMLASVATNSATNGYSNPYLPNASAAVFNEAGADIDFRAEGDTDANLLFLDASTDRVGVGTSTPDAKLTVNGVGAFGDGAVGTPSISNTGDLNTGIWFPAADTVAVSTGGAEVARLDSSGNLGLGVTPSAWWSTAKAFQVLGASMLSTGVTNSTTANAFLNSSAAWAYYGTGNATHYEQTTGQHRWFTAPSGTAGNAISFTQAMTLDASGNLGIGVTSPGTRLDLDSSGSRVIDINSTNVAGSGIRFKNSSTINGYVGSAKYIVSGGALADFGIDVSGANNLVFGTNDTERARITSEGDLLVGSTTQYSTEKAYFKRTADTAGAVVVVENTAATATNQNGQFIRLAGDPNDASRYLLSCMGNATERATIRSNGGLANYSGNNVNLSDRREKTNFAPAKSYLDTICAIPVQTFEYIDQSPDDPGLTLGVVAQDVQAVAPELVMESNWGTEDNPKMRLSIYQTDLQYALMKCIQEQQALITALTARVAALEAQP